MKKVPICWFLSCGEDESTQEEAKQEDLSSNYSQSIVAKTHKRREIVRSHIQQPKEIFSFKLHCFRNADKSDKVNTFQSPHTAETVNKLSSFGSCQKYELRVAQSPPQHSRTVRYFFPPSPKVTFKSRKYVSPQPKMIIFSAGKNTQNKLKISMASEAYQSQFERNSRKSELTIDSWKNIETQFPQTAFQQRLMDIYHKYAIQTPQHSTKKSSPFHQKGGETERTIIESLNDDQIQPRKESGFNRYDCTTQQNQINYNPATTPFLRTNHLPVLVRQMQ